MLNIFYHKEVSTHQVRCYHSFLFEIIVESVNLIQMPKEKIIITMVENNEKNIKTQSKKFYITRNCTQENFK